MVSVRKRRASVVLLMKTCDLFVKKILCSLCVMGLLFVSACGNQNADAEGVDEKAESEQAVEETDMTANYPTT